jgi:hypothetical protein
VQAVSSIIAASMYVVILSFIQSVGIALPLPFFIYS